jgi:HEAT repeat protein
MQATPVDDQTPTLTWDEWVSQGRRIDGVEVCLQQILADEEDDYSRSVAAMALGQVGSELSGQALLEALADDIPLVQMEAAAALGQIGHTEAVEPLCEALGQEDVNVRANAAMALGRIGGERAVSCLESVVDDEDSFVRTAVQAALEETR